MRETLSSRVLAVRLRAALQELMPDYDVGDVTVRPALGYWSHQQQDVMAWDGVATIRALATDGRTSVSVGSWDTVSTLLRTGFVVVDHRGDRLSYADFEVHRKEKA